MKKEMVRQEKRDERGIKVNMNFFFLAWCKHDEVESERICALYSCM